jgi:hypothetical protein
MGWNLQFSWNIIISRSISSHVARRLGAINFTAHVQLVWPCDRRWRGTVSVRASWSSRDERQREQPFPHWTRTSARRGVWIRWDLLGDRAYLLCIIALAAPWFHWRWFDGDDELLLKTSSEMMDYRRIWAWMLMTEGRVGIEYLLHDGILQRRPCSYRPAFHLDGYPHALSRALLLCLLWHLVYYLQHASCRPPIQGVIAWWRSHIHWHSRSSIDTLSSTARQSSIAAYAARCSPLYQRH